MRLKLYRRAYCHLCEEMARSLRALGIEFDQIDLGSDPELEARYGDLIPVLTDVTGEEICHYRLDEAALRNALK